jgi:hypothetical protein
MNSEFYAGGDAICLKNWSNKITYPHACKNITVANCKTVSPTNGFIIGTYTYDDFENIVFRDSEVDAGDPADPLSIEAARAIPPDLYGNGLGPEAGIALISADGAHVHGVTIKNIVMHGARVPIFIRLCSRGINPTSYEMKDRTGTIADVTISDIKADGASCASSITGVPGHPVQRISITNLQVTNIGAGTSRLTALGAPEWETEYPSALMWGPLPAHSLFVRHAEGVQLDNVNFTNTQPDTRMAIIADDVSGLILKGLSLDQAAAGDPLILLNNVHDSAIQGTIPQATKTWVQVSGTNSSNITLSQNNSQIAEKPFEAVRGAPTDAVTFQAQQ